MEPTVTLVIPLYNKIECINELAEKIAIFSSQFFEIIVVDDCSSDGSLQVLKRALAATSNVIFIELKNNVGPFSARVFGIRKAQTEWVQLIDADDELLESSSNLIGAFPVRSLIRDEIVAIAYKDGMRSVSCIGMYNLPFKGWPNCSNIVVRRSVCSDLVERRRLMWGEDHVFFCKLLAAGKMLYIPGRLANYRKEYAERSIRNGSLRNRRMCAADMFYSLRNKHLSGAVFIYLFFLSRTVAAYCYKRAARLL